ncbi:MAG: hypothetical protein Q7U04_03760 [Bacteriovorax sp.]|nr:hypothetical protein [Bacteriovorax sp.]
MEYPKIVDYENCVSYLQKFIEINHEAGVPISYRFIATKLNWPISYLNDVLHGRRTLTLTRALEFARFANFDLIETERLIFMTLKDSTKGNIQDYFSEKLEKECNSDSYSNSEKNYAGIADDFKETIEELKGDLGASSLLKLLTWSKGKINRKKIPKLLYTFSEFYDPKIIDNKIDLLEKNGNIKIITNKTSDDIEVKILKPVINFIVTKENVFHIAQFADNMGRILRDQKVSGIFNSGFITINKSKFNEVRQKLYSVRNWLMEIEKEALAAEKGGLDEALIFQYDINLAALIDYRELGIENLKIWEENIRN